MAVFKRRPLNILCLDIASYKTGVALWKDKLVYSGELVADGDYTRLLKMKGALENIIYAHWGGGDAGNTFVEVLVEAPFYSPGKSYDTSIKMAHGVFLCACHDFLTDRFSWDDVNVSTWRSFIFRHFNIPKEETETKEGKKAVVERLMAEHFKTSISGNNAADAAGMLFWRLYGGQEERAK